MSYSRKFLLRTVCLLGTVLTLNTITGCNSGEEESTLPAVEPVQLTIVHNGEVNPVVQSLSNALLSPTESSPIPIILKSVVLPEKEAAEKLSSGELKADAWLPSDPSWVGYLNARVKNLGAEQGKCTPSFHSPFQIAVHRDDSDKLPKNEDGQVRWEEFLSSQRDHQAAKNDGNALRLRVTSPRPDASAYGFGAVLGLYQLLLPNLEEKSIMDQLTDSESKKLLHDLLATLVTRYPESPQVMLKDLSNQYQGKIRIGLSTERMIKSLGSIAPAIVGLDTARPLPVQQYVLCETVVDWYTNRQQQALSQFTAEANRIFAKKATTYGFRPGAPKDGGEQKNEHETLELVLKTWPELEVPLKTIYAFDRSGSFEGELFTNIREAVATASSIFGEDDNTAIVTFSTEPTLSQSFTSDRHLIRRVFDKLEPLGGSALYDAIRMSFQLHEQDSVLDKTNLRRAIVLVTDGANGNTGISESVLQNIVRNNRTLQDITFVMILVTQEGAPVQRNTSKIIEELGGEVLEATPNELLGVLIGVQRNL